MVMEQKLNFKIKKEEYIKLQKDIDLFYIDIINSGKCERILSLVDELELNENDEIEMELDDYILNLPNFKQFEKLLTKINLL